MSVASNQFRPNRTDAWALVALVVLCAIVKVCFWQVYQPIVAADTVTFAQVASDIGRMDFSAYLGRRTPVYPLLLVAAQMQYKAVWLIQSVLGVGVSVLLFLLVVECVPDRRLAFAVALLHCLTLNQLFFEAMVLSETLATFFIVASVLIFVRASDGSHRTGTFVLLGLCSALATLTRPLYIYLGPLYFILLLTARQTRNKRRLTAFVAAFALPIIGLMAFNKLTLDYFGLTTQVGIGLSQHSGKFIEKAPDEFATLRDIYLKHRAQMPPDAHHMSTWEAVSEMLAVTRLSFVDLNRQLTKLSLLLFVRYPDLYFRSVLDAWLSFWAVPNPWLPELIRGYGMRRALEWIWFAEHVLLRAMNLIFFVVSLCLAPRALLALLKGSPANAYIVIASVVLAASVVQALLEATDNARYSIPTQPLVTVFVIALAFQYIQGRTRRQGVAAIREGPK